MKNSTISRHTFLRLSEKNTFFRFLYIWNFYIYHLDKPECGKRTFSNFLTEPFEFFDMFQGSYFLPVVHLLDIAIGRHSFRGKFVASSLPVLSSSFETVANSKLPDVWRRWLYPLGYLKSIHLLSN